MKSTIRFLLSAWTAILVAAQTQTIITSTQTTTLWIPYLSTSDGVELWASKISGDTTTEFVLACGPTFTSGPCGDYAGETLTYAPDTAIFKLADATYSCSHDGGKPRRRDPPSCVVNVEEEPPTTTSFDSEGYANWLIKVNMVFTTTPVPKPTGTSSVIVCDKPWDPDSGDIGDECSAGWMLEVKNTSLLNIVAIFVTIVVV